MNASQDYITIGHLDLHTSYLTPMSYVTVTVYYCQE